MSGVNGLFEAKSPVPNDPCSLHRLGRPCPDSRTNTSKRFASPRNAIPVGIFRPEAKTDTLNPAGTIMSWPWSGLNNTFSPEQSGFVTVAAVATVGRAKNGANANAADRAWERLGCMDRFLPLP